MKYMYYTFVDKHMLCSVYERLITNAVKKYIQVYSRE